MEINQQVKSLRAFIGAKNFELSRFFYKDLGFEEHIISDKMSLFEINGLSFYLQDYYVQDWMDNTMMLMEVDNVEEYWNFLQHQQIDKKYEGISLSPIRNNDWGMECLLTDPSGVLWHLAQFHR